MQDKPSNSKTSLEQTFCTFFIEDSEFAIHVDSVQEVIDVPDKYIEVPLSPDYMKGLHNLRGTVIPVLNLRDLLNISSALEGSESQIVIVELDGSCVGLIIDRTGEILQSPDEERTHFNSEHSARIIHGVIKKDRGQRMIQIMNVASLFKLKHVPKDTNQSRRALALLQKKRGARKKCISFTVGLAKCALSISGIQEIIKLGTIQNSVLAAGSCVGIIDLRGDTIPILDFSALLNKGDTQSLPPEASEHRRILIMRQGSDPFGLIVDSVDSIVAYFPDELIPFPIVEQDRSNMFIGCITGQGKSETILLDHSKIISLEELSEITQGHSKLYASKAATSNSEISKNAQRESYITFHIEHAYAVPMKSLKEIIQYPSSLLHPPGLPRHIRGILKLRDFLVTIIDPMNSSAQAEKESDSGKGNVLVFERQGSYFGLVVDSIDSIVHFSSSDKVKLPKTLNPEDASNMLNGISEAVEITDHKGQKQNILILYVDAFDSLASQTLSAQNVC
jgi:purine-binding chemotaxis protein CheW